MESLEFIHDADSLLRRAPYTDPNYIKPDGSLSSFAFTPKRGEDGLSVNIERLTTYEKSLQDHNRFRLYSIMALEPRRLGLTCRYDPLPDNNAHALIVGHFTKGISRQLAARASRVAYPD